MVCGKTISKRWRRNLTNCWRARCEMWDGVDMLHFTMEWRIVGENKNNSSIGDYAQMLEFAGVPELGVVALLYHRSRRRRISCSVEETPQVTMTPTQLRMMIRIHLGYDRILLQKVIVGVVIQSVAANYPFLPGASSEMQSVIDALKQYDEQCQSRMTNMPSSYSVLVSLAKSKAPYPLDYIPELLLVLEDSSRASTL